VIEVATADELSFLWGEEKRGGQFGRGREEIYVGQVGKLEPKKRVDTIRKVDILSAEEIKTATRISKSMQELLELT
jgi:hypothetical protein